jgi:LPXTG-motif cell wall-anchored protein
VSVRLALSGAVLVGAALSGTAVAQEVCDPYSQGCVPVDCESDPELSTRSETRTRTEVDPQGNTIRITEVIDGCDIRSTREVTPRTLPFTGGEVVTLSLVGGTVLAAGVGLVVAGRRRRTASDV